MRVLLTSAALLALSAHLAHAQDAGGGGAVALPAIDVVATSPLQGTGVDRDKIPGTVQSLTSDDVDPTTTSSTLDALQRKVPGVSLTDVQGNAFLQDLRYRGFAASPLQGTPPGLAIYQNGIRINEAFGDTVNWDLIPQVAINRLDTFTNNPVFGLNALGGAVNIQMKNGFTWQGFEAQAQGGSYGRIGGSFQYGVQKDSFSLYVADEATRDQGWRFQSPSRLQRFYADLGYKVPGAEFHVVASQAISRLGVVGATPIELTRLDDRSIFTWPQTTENQMGSLAINGKIEPSSTWTIEGNVFVRHFGQHHSDGNLGNFEGCSSRSSFGGRLCLEDDAFGTPAGGKTTAFRNQFVILNSLGATLPFVSGVPYGTIDRTQTIANTVGGSLQATNTEQVFGHDNHFVIGGGLDHSDIAFGSSSELGYVYPNLFVGLNPIVPGLTAGSIIHTLGNLGYAPVDLSANNTHYGAYVVDTFDVTPRLAVTLGARLNIDQISTNDASGAAPELNGDHTYSRINPVIGATYKLMPWVTAYGGYSQSNRAPTPLELDCASRTNPCLLENSLVADPSLKQVVSHTYEAGLRGHVDLNAASGLDWKAGAYRVDSKNDIVSLASSIQGRGYFANVPGTRRQGVEAGLRYQAEQWSFYANYALVDATYRFAGTLASPNNPFADADGNVNVRPGNHIPGIPRHQLKLGADYEPLPGLKVGGDIVAFSSQYYVGDDSNLNPKLPGYWVMNLHASYQVTPNFEIFGLANNVLNRRYASYGTFFDTGSLANATPFSFSDARTITLAQPFSVYGGVKVRF